jgi:NCS1 family nucleobase:cation symporter-1
MAPETMASIDATTTLGITLGQAIAFFLFWVLNVVIIVRGVEALKVFETWAAPFLLVTGLALLVWAWVRVGDFGAMVTSPPSESSMSTFAALAVGITGAVSFWGTLALNIPDFTRYAKSQREQAIGQAISLPTTMTFYVFIGAAVTNATLLIFGTTIADPVAVLARAGGPLMVGIAMIGLIVATLSTNLAANVVSPANGFANLAPRHINFRRGALITALVGLVIMPWKMWEDPNAYVVTWLVGCGGLLGAVGGIMIADYFVVRKTELDLDDLYRFDGRYGGVNPVALVALIAALLPLVPGFLGSLLHVVVPPFGPWVPAILGHIYSWSWFVAFLVAGATYLVGSLALTQRKRW